MRNMKKAIVTGANGMLASNIIGELLKDGITEDSARAFAAYTAESVPTGSNVRGSAAYRTHLVNVLAKRSALELGGMQKWN